jgi:outer membrane protein insertion porin family
MIKRNKTTRFRLGAALLCVLLPLSAVLAEEFVVKDMRVEGLQRISEGTVFNYLPINVGDRIDDVRIREAIRSLYTQGLFDDIELRREGDTLIIAVHERPSIESFAIEGNKDIKTEDLMESLRAVGLAKGRTFDRSVLDNVQSFMREQYYDRGKYGVSIDASVIDRPNNTVRVKIDVKEGDRAKIRPVNIVGNTVFEEKDIREDFELDTANWLSWIRQDDRYSKEALEGDLETLRSYYMDRGYADFRVDSTQVAISPNKKDIYVTIGIHEGDLYTISEVKLVGEMVVPEQYLRALVLAQPGSYFNQNMLTQTSELMSLRLGVTSGNATDGRCISVESPRGPIQGPSATSSLHRSRRSQQQSGSGQPRPRRCGFRTEVPDARAVQRWHRLFRVTETDVERQHRAHEFPG